MYEEGEDRGSVVCGLVLYMYVEKFERTGRGMMISSPILLLLVLLGTGTIVIKWLNLC